MIIEQIIGLIAPHYCLGCDKLGEILCKRCSQDLPILPSRCYACQSITKEFATCSRCRNHSPEKVFCATAYDGLAKKVVRKLKFGRSAAAAQPMASIMSRVVPDYNWLVVPIPTATSRARQRGYDQAYILASRLAKYNNFEFSPLLLRRNHNRQVGQTRKQRQEQIAGSFRVPFSPRKVAGRSILLVDDVITTGATLEAAAQTLKPFKPATVCAAVFSAA